MIETILAVVGGLAGLIGLAISIKAERRAARAEARGDAAQERQLWTESVLSVQGLVAVNLLNQDPGPLLLKTRTAFVELTDGLPDPLGKVTGEWLAEEHRRLSLLMENTFNQLSGQPPTLELMEAAHKPVTECAGLLLSNLRFARSHEKGPDLELQLQKLAENAKTDADMMARRMGKDTHDE